MHLLHNLRTCCSRSCRALASCWEPVACLSLGLLLPPSHAANTSSHSLYSRPVRRARWLTSSCCLPSCDRALATSAVSASRCCSSAAALLQLQAAAGAPPLVLCWLSQSQQLLLLLRTQLAGQQPAGEPTTVELNVDVLTQALA